MRRVCRRGLRRTGWASVALLALTMLVAPAARADGGVALRLPILHRGATSSVGVSGLDPGGVYTLRSDVAIFGGTDSVSVTANAAGFAWPSMSMPSDLPLATTSYTVSVLPGGGGSVLATASTEVAPPSLYLVGYLCPGGSDAYVEYLGLPDGTYDLSSPGVTLTPSSVVVSAGAPMAFIKVEAAATAPHSFPITFTLRGQEAYPVTFTASLGAPILGWADWFNSYPTTDSVSCLHPGALVTLSSTTPGVTFPHTVRADSTGAISFAFTALSGPGGRAFDLTVDDGSGSVTTGRDAVPATTVRAPSTDFALVSPHLDASAHFVQSSFAVGRWVREQDGSWRYQWLWVPDAPPWSHVQLRADGALVMLRGTTTVWSNGAQLTGTGNTLTVDDTGDLVERTSRGAVVWSSRYGRHVLYVNQSLLAGQSLKWQDTTLTMQTNGNLVLREAGRGLWNTHTSGSGATHVTMSSNGNLTLATSTGRTVWTSGTLHSGSANHLVVYDSHLAMVTAQGHVPWHV